MIYSRNYLFWIDNLKKDADAFKLTAETVY